MKKILFVINTLGTAGAEKALLQLLSEIDSSKYQVDLFVLLNQGELIDSVPKSVNVLNDKYDVCPIYGKEGKKHLAQYVFRALLKKGCCFKFLGFFIDNLFSMIKSRNVKVDKLLWQAVAYSSKRFDTLYDLAVAYIEGGSTYYVSQYVNANKKVAFLHVDYQEAGYSRKIDRGAYKNVDMVYAVSDEVQESFLKTYPEYKEKTGIFHNIIDIEKIKRLASTPGGFEDEFDGIRILTVGRLCAQKAFEYSIEALKILKDKGIRVKWYVLGSGDEEERLRKMICEMDLKEEFLLLGNQSNPYPYFEQCDIYVHASRFEGKSIAVQEAQALAKPIIVSDCAGNREQVIHMYDGMMCNLSGKEIADAIMFLIDNRDQAASMGQKAYERIVCDTAKNNELENMLSLA